MIGFYGGRERQLSSGSKVHSTVTDDDRISLTLTSPFGDSQTASLSPDDAVVIATWLLRDRNLIVEAVG